MSVWEPLDTAPKNGSWIIGLTTHDVVEPCRWISEDDPDEEFGSHEWGRDNGVRFHLKGWKALPLARTPMVELYGAALPICEAAVMSDGRVVVGYTNRDENGGFTPVGDITAWWNAKQHFYAEKMAETAKKVASNIEARLEEVMFAIRSVGGK